MAGSSCPFPLVEQALTPYIHTRQETLEIRRLITNYLTSQLHEPSTRQTPSHLDLSIPSGQLYTSSVNTNALPFGIYKRYFEALAAHERAKRQYEALRTELDELQGGTQNGEGRANGREEGSTMDAGLKEYIALLRQREKHRKLGIMQAALRKLQDAQGNPTRVELKSHLKSVIGEPPEPPQASHRSSNSSSTQSIEHLTTRLKKDLILANSRVQESQAAQAEVAEMAADLPEPSAAVKVAALRNTRDRLIAWVEEELGRVPEDESVVEDEELDEYINGGQARRIAEEVEQEVQSLYRCYVDSRAALLRDVQSLCSRDRRPGPSSTDSPGAASRDDELHENTVRPRATRTASIKHSTAVPSTSQIQPSELLPFLPTLIAASRNEAALQAQTTYLRRQLASANEDTTKTLQRLAGESYLVPPGASSTEAWAQAAIDAATKTEVYVNEQVDAGSEGLKIAEGALRKVQARRSALDTLKVMKVDK